MCGDLEIEAVTKVLKSKKLFRYQGKDKETECSIFEKKFARFLKTKKAILVSSGTNAIVNSLYCLNIQEGDEILIPSYTFFATAAAILEIKAIPIVVNIDKYLSFDPVDLNSKLTHKTKAVIAVHMDGAPCNMIFLNSFCEKNNLFLIEDVAQAVGGSFQNKKLGTFGLFGCFSFNVDKIISCGEGGAISINNEELYQKSFLYHDTCNQFGETNRDLYDITKFSGKSMRTSEIQGALINVQLDQIEKIFQNLKERKSLLESQIKSSNLELVPSYDVDGDCGTTCRILCSDPNEAKELVLKFNNLGLYTNTPLLRPAHSVWQWNYLLPPNSSQHKFDFLSSIDLLSRIILIHIKLDEDIQSWKDKISKINV